MAKQSNQYPGINPHLNSLLQTPGTEDQPSLWHSFHSQHITNIVEALNEQLPDHYLAIGEQSLQSRTLDISGTITLRRPEPDVSIFQQTAAQTASRGYAIPAPTWEADIVDVIQPVKHPTAAVIREVKNQAALGKIVTRIELLSPSNKPGGGDAKIYVEKRIEAIQSGIPLIEIDYLHESPSPIEHLPIYPNDSESRPYTIAVSDPRPVWQEGTMRVYGFSVGEPIAICPIPLAVDENILFNLDAVYQLTFRRGRWGNLVDYETEPLRFFTYSRNDQEIIRRQMAELNQP